MAIVKVMNTSSVAQRIEFLTKDGNADSCTVFSKHSVHVDLDLLLTSAAECTKRGLKIGGQSGGQEKVSPKVAAPEPQIIRTTFTQGNTNNPKKPFIKTNGFSNNSNSSNSSNVVSTVIDTVVEPAVPNTSVDNTDHSDSNIQQDQEA